MVGWNMLILNLLPRPFNFRRSILKFSIFLIMEFPPSLERLIQEFSKLPSVGRRTAQRLALKVLRDTPEDSARLADAILAVKQKVRFCSQCYAFTEQDLCGICNDPSRRDELLCIVEQPHNIFSIEKSNAYRGRYHVLMGAISPLDGIGAEQLTISQLDARLKSVKEVILATNSTVSGEATALFLKDYLEKFDVTLSRLARGLPSGGELEYADDITLIEAFSGRRELI